MGSPSFEYSRALRVTGRPCPVSARLPWKTAFTRVLLPTPLRPAMTMLTRPRLLRASSSWRRTSSARLKSMEEPFWAAQR
jgi:hypothetical protein